MIKSSHYNNNISNGSSLIVRVRYVYVHQHEARPFLKFRNRRVFLCSLMLFIRPCRLHRSPERSEVYPYHPDFSHIRKVGVLHILFQYIIFSPKQNRGIGEKTGKLPIFARPLTSSISPISRFFAKNAT